MGAPADQEFLRSVFLMEAWDTLAVIEDAIAALAGDARPADELFVVTHRLKGTASLYGFLEVARLAQAMEQVLTILPDASAETRRGATAHLQTLAGELKACLDAIGASPVTVDGHGGATADPVRDELEKFFANVEVVEYFRPEAAEHLDAMAAALGELGRGGDADAEIGRLFRIVHTLKGSALVVGCAPVGHVAHRLEDLLVDMRGGRLRLTSPMVESMFATVEAIRTMLRIVPDDSINLTEVAERLMGTLADLLSAPGEPGDSAPAGEAAAAPAPPVREEREAPRVGVRPVQRTIRVNLEHLDGLMDLVGELLVARRRFDRRLSDLDRVGEVLSASRTRMDRVVADFEREHGRFSGPGEPGAPVPAPLAAGEGPVFADLFAELEFDRYDDFGLLMRSVGEISADLSEARSELSGLGRSARNELAELQHLSGRLRQEISRARLVPLGPLLTRFVRQGEEAARAVGKAVRIVASGEAVVLDAGITEQIIDPVFHLIQNALVHGIEDAEERLARGKSDTGTITVTASHQGAFVIIEVADDGRGIDTGSVRSRAVAEGFLGADVAASLSEREALDLIFLPGLSTAPAVTTAAGRGVGMDVVRTNVGRLNGQVEVHTEIGAGSRLTLKLPVTLIVSEALTVRAGDERFAIPLNAVRRVATQPASDVRVSAHGETVVVEDEPIDLIRLDRALALPSPTRGAHVETVLVHAGHRTIALEVDEVVQKEEIVIKSLGRFLEGVGPFAGATISADGQVSLLLDPVKLLAAATRPSVAIDRSMAGPAITIAPPPAAARGRRVLLVDDSISVRKFVGQMLVRAGFEVTTANDGAEALAKIADAGFDVVVTDLEMPRVNGYELLDTLRRRPQARALPVIVLTTRSGDKHAGLARRLGASHYVTKPVEEHAFVRLVASLLAPGRDHDVGANAP